MERKTYQQGKIEMAKEFVNMLQMAHDELDCHPDVLKEAIRVRDRLIEEGSKFKLPSIDDPMRMEDVDIALSNMRTAVRIYENNIKATGRWDSVAWRLADALLLISKKCPKDTQGIDTFTGMGAKLCVSKNTED